MKKINKTGIVFVALYLVFSLVVYLYSFSCSGNFCGFYILMIALPWILMGPVLDLFWVISWPLFFTIVILLNLVLFYFVGLGLSRLFGRFFKRVDTPTLSNNMQEKIDLN